MFGFIVMCTRAPASCSTLCSAATDILDRLRVPQSYPDNSIKDLMPHQRFNVPALQMQSYKEKLKVSIELLSHFENLQGRLTTDKAIFDSSKTIINSIAMASVSFVNSDNDRIQAMVAVKDANEKKATVLVW